MNSLNMRNQHVVLNQAHEMRLNYQGVDDASIADRTRNNPNSVRSDSRRAVDEWRRSPLPKLVVSPSSKTSRLERLGAWLWHIHDHSTAVWVVISVAFLAGAFAINAGIWKP